MAPSQDLKTQSNPAAAAAKPAAAKPAAAKPAAAKPAAAKPAAAKPSAAKPAATQPAATQPAETQPAAAKPAAAKPAATQPAAAKPAETQPAAAKPAAAKPAETQSAETQPAAAAAAAASKPTNATSKSGAATEKPTEEKSVPISPLSTKSSNETKTIDTGVLKYTPLNEIKDGVQRLSTVFNTTKKTYSLQFRLNQIRNVYFAVKDNEEAICEALFKDFNRSYSETKNLEFTIGLNSCLHIMANLHKWIKPEKVTGLPTSMASTPVYIEKIPLGVVLVITPFNYPLYMALPQVVGAIAAGNAVVLKQSEHTPHFSQLFSDILTKALDPDIFYAVNGSIPETTELLDQKFDKIIYTGNNAVGKIIAKKAAENLTPVILELGGKSPAFVLEDVSDADLKTAAKRIVWGRFTNSGQTCVAVDYVLVHKSRHQQLVREIKLAIATFFESISKENPKYTHLIHERAFNNLSGIIDKTKGDIVAGGDTDAATNYISPTVVDNCTWDDSTMAGELFGPILPIIEYSDIHEAVKDVIRYHDTPLAMYIFSSKPNREKNPEVDHILKMVRSGGVILNDVVLHVGLSNAPFGGIGQSGYGNYHGEYSFKAFSHERTTMEIAFWKEPAMSARYPPTNEAKEKLLGLSMHNYGGYEWFGRTGDVRKNGPSFGFKLYAGVGGLAALGYYFYQSM